MIRMLEGTQISLRKKRDSVKEIYELRIEGEIMSDL